MLDEVPRVVKRQIGPSYILNIAVGMPAGFAKPRGSFVLISSGLRVIVVFVE